MQFMVIETFRDQNAKAVYRKFRDKGRMMPEGLAFVSSYVAADLSRCFQLMECDDAALLQQWVLHWRGTGASFEIVPVTPSAQTRASVEALLDTSG